MDKLCTWMVAYFDIFGVECIWKEIERFVDNKNIKIIYRIWAYKYNSIICGYFCIAFIEYMSKAKILLDYTDLFYANEYEKKVWMTHTYFKDKNNRGKVYTWVKHMSRRNNKSVLTSKKHKKRLNGFKLHWTITYNYLFLLLLEMFQFLLLLH